MSCWRGSGARCCLSEPPRVRLAGHLHLVCAAHVERGTFVREQSFSAPLHLSKPYWDGATLLVNVVNQTAGIFGGDGVDVRIAVESGARVLLSSPTAALFHPSHGREAHLEQRFQVDAGASLDVLPRDCYPARRLALVPADDHRPRAGRRINFHRVACAGPRRHGRDIRVRALRLGDRGARGRAARASRAGHARSATSWAGRTACAFPGGLPRGHHRRFARSGKVALRFRRKSRRTLRQSSPCRGVTPERSRLVAAYPGRRQRGVTGRNQGIAHPDLRTTRSARFPMRAAAGDRSATLPRPAFPSRPCRFFRRARIRLYPSRRELRAERTFPCWPEACRRA